MSDNIGKELAAREIAKALEKLSIDELRKLAERYGVDIDEALEGEPLLKADLSDEAADPVAKLERLFAKIEAEEDLRKRDASDPIAKMEAALDKAASYVDGRHEAELAKAAWLAQPLPAKTCGPGVVHLPAEEIAKLAPAPSEGGLAKRYGARLQAVDKGADAAGGAKSGHHDPSDEEVNKFLASLSPEDRALELIKATHRFPVAVR